MFMKKLLRVGLSGSIIVTIFPVLTLVLGSSFVNSDMIVYHANYGGLSAIYLYDRNTGVTQKLTDNFSDSDLQEAFMADVSEAHIPSGQSNNVTPAWSPDGRWLAFVSYRDGNAEIYLFNLDTGRLRNLTNYPGMDTSPVWSPDSTKLAFESLRDGYWGIWLLDLDTELLTALTDQSMVSKSPSWSPDSRRVVFQGKNNGYWNIFLLDLESQQLQNITINTGDAFHPVWGRRH